MLLKSSSSLNLFIITGFLTRWVVERVTLPVSIALFWARYEARVVALGEAGVKVIRVLETIKEKEVFIL